jgi:putative DNA primase/helicase
MPSADELQRLADASTNKSGDCIRPEDLRDAGLNHRDALLTVTDDAEIWRTPDGATFASIRRDGHIEHHSILSREFRDWMIMELGRRYKLNGRPASVGENPIREALNALEARAALEGKVHKATVRVARAENTIVIDKGDPDWKAFEITKEGWQVATNPLAHNVRNRRTAAFPDPFDHGDFEPLRRILRRLDEDEFILFVAWCLAALWPEGPYPVLILGGEQGSGKSTIARLGQRLVDPVNGDLLQPPTSDRDLIAAARNGRVLAFDNVSAMRPDLADSLCRISTGAEIGGRALYTDHDMATFHACRPIILNGIPDLAARGDLADRSVIIKLAPLTETITESDFWSEVKAALPATIAALLDALVMGLRRIGEVPTPNMRMADFTRLIVAAEPALPWDEGDFLGAYEASRRRMVTTIVEGDLVGDQIVNFVQRNGDFDGLISTLYNILSQDLSPERKRLGDWPGNARWFSDRLRRIAPALRTMGISVTTKETSNGTRVTIQK